MASVADDEIRTDAKKPGGQVRCVVVTPERTLFDQVVDFVALPLFDGEIGVLAGRAPFIGRLGYGELRTKQAGAAQRYFIEGGFAQVRDNVVTVLTNQAVPAASIDASAAARSLEEAKTLAATSPFLQAEKDKAVDRARAMIRMSAHTG